VMHAGTFSGIAKLAGLSNSVFIFFDGIDPDRATEREGS